MKLLAAVLVTAAVLVGAAVAGTATVTPPQLAALAKRVTTLEHRTATLEKANAALNDYVAICLKTFTAVSQYGGAADGSGFVYVDNAAKDTFNTTALDLTETGQAPAYWFLSAPQSCVKATAAATR